MYLGFVLIGCVGTHRYENEYHRRSFYVHRSLATGSMTCHTELYGKAPGLVRRQKEQGESMAKSLYYCFQGKEWARQGRQLSRRRIGQFEYSRGF